MMYFDNAATTKPSATALEKASVYNGDSFFNASALYDGGIKQKKAILDAKSYLLSAFTCGKHDVYFTSCGTESDNQAVFCTVNRGTFVTTKVEHSAIFKSFTELKNRGKDVVFSDVNRDGSVNEEKLYDFLSSHKDTSFLSVVHVNNETGAINDINKISKTAKSICPELVFHSDGVQAFGKIPYRLSETVDLYSVSAHKINALKGTGALFVKKGVPIKPLIFGGGQEDGMRSGTENVFGIKVFEAAAREHFETLSDDFKRISLLKERLITKLSDKFTVLSPKSGSPYIVSMACRGVRGEVIMHALEPYGIVVGNGSACSSKSRYSRVLTACGVENGLLDGVVRISFSNRQKEEEVDFLAEKLNEVVGRLSAL